MVSVLIPVFGENIDAQVARLIDEIKVLDYNVEIIVCDDASPNPMPPYYTKYPNLDLKFIALKENLGRSNIRNYLADQASYNCLIFMDADCQPILGNYVSNYVNKFQENHILVGGQLFNDEKPFEQEKLLRWTYGTQVEARSLKDRAAAPFKSFMANNFSISKQLLQQYPFDKEHKGYGHEDTVFGNILRDNQLKVIHIQNPIRHIVIETNQEFLDKSAEGAKNLAQLYVNGQLDRHVKLIKRYEQLKLTGFAKLTRSVLSKRLASYTKDLQKGANLRKFSLFKLTVFMIELNRLQQEEKS